MVNGSSNKEQPLTLQMHQLHAPQIKMQKNFQDVNKKQMEKSKQRKNVIEITIIMTLAKSLCLNKKRKHAEENEEEEEEGEGRTTIETSSLTNLNCRYTQVLLQFLSTLRSFLS